MPVLEIRDLTIPICRFVNGGILLGTLCVASCAAPHLPVAVDNKPHSKPLKIPSTHKSTGDSTGIGIEELFKLQQSGDLLLYDVRVPYFYQIDHLPGAINWPYTDYAGQIQTRDLEIQKAIAMGKRVVIYCFNYGCPEARDVAHKLARRDYKVSVFGAGSDAWRSAGLPMD
jgi:rhodanese-related sulfurtransferase